MLLTLPTYFGCRDILWASEEEEFTKKDSARAKNGGVNRFRPKSMFNVSRLKGFLNLISARLYLLSMFLEVQLDLWSLLEHSGATLRMLMMMGCRCELTIAVGFSTSTNKFYANPIWIWSTYFGVTINYADFSTFYHILNGHLYNIFDVFKKK